MVSDLIDQHPGRFAVVTSYFSEFDVPYTVPWAQDRFSDFYSLAFAPALFVDGESNCPETFYPSCVEQRLDVGTDVTLDLSGTQVSGSTWDIEAEVCIEDGGSSRAMRVYTAATLSYRSGLPSYTRNLLMQDVLTQDVNLGSGSCQTVTQRITFDSESWSNQSDITIIAWAQESSATGPASVHQAAIMGWPFQPASELTTIEISPSTTELEFGESRSLTATGKDQYGADFPLSNPAWSMTGTGDGTFDPPSGSATTQFSATLVGNLRVTCTDGSVSGEAWVVITGDPPVLSEIVVSPSSAEMEVGQRRSFGAEGHDQYGYSFSLNNPQWHTTGDGSGTFEPANGSTAPIFTAMAPGALQVVCSEDGVSGQSSVIITGDPPQLAVIAISPETATTVLGASLVFTASGTDQYGKPFSPDNAAWSVSGDGDGTFDPASGGAAITFTATAVGSSTVTVQQDGLEATASIIISEEGLPKPRRVKTRHTP